MKFAIICILLIKLYSILAVSLTYSNEDNKHSTETLGTELLDAIAEKGQSVMSNMEMERQLDDYESEKQRYYDLLREKLLQRKSKAGERFPLQKRRINKEKNQEADDSQKKRNYYTRPCLLNAISCYFYG